MDKKIGFILILLIGAGAGLNSFAQTSSTPGAPTAAIVAASKKFLATLDDAQRGKVVFEFKDEAQRKRWSNLPTAAFKRQGLRIGDLTKPQHDAVLAVLASALSPQGYEKILQIVEADEVLRKSSGQSMFGRDEYYVSLLGQPSATEPWMIQFGGHHLGLNVTLAGEQRTLAPSHTGAQPAIYELEGKTVRPLGRETDRAFALLSSLNEAQRKQAILDFQMRDLVLGPGRDGQTIQPEGVKGSALTEKQRQMLLDLAGEWTGILHEAAAKAKMDEIKKNIAETWFAWSGPTEKGSAAYFRIQGPTVIIEYAPQRLGGDPTKAHPHDLPRSNERLRHKMAEAVTRTRRHLPLLLALLAFPSAVFAHRDDQYLQATLVAIEPSGVRLQINLTPGVAVAEQVLAQIDRDRDGAISKHEAADYAKFLKRDLTLRIDGRKLELKLTGSEFVPPAELRTGAGTIRMEFSASSGSFAAGAHRLALENRHLTAISVYLINAAQPRFATVQITRQKRNTNQSEGDIDFTFHPFRPKIAVFGAR